MLSIVPTLPAPQGSPYRLGFVCLGNICRSPVAEVVLTHLLDEAGMSAKVHVESCGTGPWHVGEPMDARAAGHLLAQGYDPSGHLGRQWDAGRGALDLVLAMDAANLAEVSRGDGENERMQLFRVFDPLAGEPTPDVPDPYYGGEDGFVEVLAMVERTCARLLTGLQALELAR